MDEPVGFDPFTLWMAFVILLVWITSVCKKRKNSRTRELKRRRLLGAARESVFEIFETGACRDPSAINALRRYDGYSGVVLPGAVKEKILTWSRDVIYELKTDAEREKTVRRVGIDTLDDYQVEAEDLFSAAADYTDGHSRKFWRSLILQLQDFKSMDRAELRMVVQKQFNGYVQQVKLDDDLQEILYGVCREFVSAHVPRPLDFQR